MVKKRALKRRHLIYYLMIFNTTTDEVIGHMIDITTGGLMIMSEKPIKTGKTYQLRMDLLEKLRELNKFHLKPEAYGAK